MLEEEGPLTNTSLFSPHTPGTWGSVRWQKIKSYCDMMQHSKGRWNLAFALRQQSAVQLQVHWLPDVCKQLWKTADGIREVLSTGVRLFLCPGTPNPLIVRSSSQFNHVRVKARRCFLHSHLNLAHSSCSSNLFWMGCTLRRTGGHAGSLRQWLRAIILSLWHTPTVLPPFQLLEFESNLQSFVRMLALHSCKLLKSVEIGEDRSWG